MSQQSFKKFVSPLLTLSRYLGASSLNERSELSYKWIAWSFLVSLATFVIESTFAISLLRAPAAVLHRGTAGLVFLLLRLKVVSLIGLTNWVQQLMKREHLLACVKDLSYAEVLLAKMDIRFSYKYSDVYLTWIVCNLYLAVYLIITIFYSGNLKFWSMQTLGIYSWVVVSSSVLYAVEFQFYLFVQILKDLSEAVGEAVLLKENRKQLEALAVVHYILCQVGDRVNAIYSFQNIVIQSYYYICFIGFSWESLFELTKIMKDLDSIPFNIDVMKNMIVYVPWILLSFGHLQIAASCCSSAREKARRVNDSFYRAALKKISLFSEKLRLHLEVDRQLEFTTCGLFPIDYAMIYCVISSLFILLVTIPQLMGANDLASVASTTALLNNADI